MLVAVALFCPHCKEGGGLWVSPRELFRVKCKVCKEEWEHNELNEICWKLLKKAESDRKFQWWASCLRIQMQYTINSFTGRCYT